VFADAFTMAVEGLNAPRERLVAELRYGLDGAPGRTFQQIGQALGRSRPGPASYCGAPYATLRWPRLGPDPT
jgi:hypothetical protein